MYRDTASLCLGNKNISCVHEVEQSPTNHGVGGLTLNLMTPVPSLSVNEWSAAEKVEKRCVNRDISF